MLDPAVSQIVKANVPQKKTKVCTAVIEDSSNCAHK